MKIIFVSLILASTQALAGPLFDCKVLPGNYVGYWDKNLREIGADFTLTSDNLVQAVITLVPKDGSEVLHTRIIKEKMEVTRNSANNFAAGAYDTDSAKTTLAEVKLKKADGKWLGYLYDGGVSFDLSCDQK